MKRLGILIIALAVLLIGFSTADPGVPKVNEVQGLSTSTTVVAAGNFNSASSVDLTISTRVPLTGIPGPEWINESLPAPESAAANQGASIYQTVYTEDTQNAEAGYISYDKDLDVSTANKAAGQQNIQAVKQITYLGVDASSVITNDYLMLDDAGWPDWPLRMMCPFAGGMFEAAYPAFCNRIETGSNMNLKVANLDTQMGDRFIMKSADPGVGIFNTVGVGSYATDLPSKGSVSAYIKSSIKEGGRSTDIGMGAEDDIYGPFGTLYETVTFSDSTTVSGDISTFAKGMSYNSVIDTSGDVVQQGK